MYFFHNDLYTFLLQYFSDKFSKDGQAYLSAWNANWKVHLTTSKKNAETVRGSLSKHTLMHELYCFSAREGDVGTTQKSSKGV